MGVGIYYYYLIYYLLFNPLFPIYVPLSMGTEAYFEAKAAHAAPGAFHQALDFTNQQYPAMTQTRQRAGHEASRFLLISCILGPLQHVSPPPLVRLFPNLRLLVSPRSLPRFLGGLVFLI